MRAVNTNVATADHRTSPAQALEQLRKQYLTSKTPAALLVGQRAGDRLRHAEGAQAPIEIVEQSTGYILAQLAISWFG